VNFTVSLVMILWVVGEPEQHSMRGGRQADEDYRLAADLHEVLGRVINTDVQMADACLR